jgi:hypothetical protein
MTLEEFHKIISKPKSGCDGFEIHLKHLWEHNGAKSIFYITGLDFSKMFKGREDTSGVYIKPRG